MSCGVTPKKHNDICIEKYVQELPNTLKCISVINTMCYYFLFHDTFRVPKCKCLLKIELGTLDF